MSLTLAICSRTHATLFADSAGSGDHGIERLDQVKQFLLPGCVALQFTGDAEGYRVVREIANRAAPLPLGAYRTLILGILSATPWAPDPDPDASRACTLIGLDERGRLSMTSIWVGPEGGPEVRGTDWDACPNESIHLANSGFHALDPAHVEARHRAIAALPWPEAAAAARALFDEMAASNPQFVGGPTHMLEMLADHRLQSPSALPAHAIGVNSSNRTTTASYEPNSVTSSVQESVSSKTMGSTATLLCSVTLTNTAGVVSLIAGGQFENLDPSNSHTWTISLYKGDNTGTELVTFSSAGAGLGPGAAAGTPQLIALDQSPASSQQYTLYGQSSGGQVEFAGTLLAMNLKA